ncbi:MAG: CsgG/HfaB family protein [Rhodospirillales bacterium]|jgi:curli biogenesis system outer membrane secretion channel CsgG
MNNRLKAGRAVALLGTLVLASACARTTEYVRAPGEAPVVRGPAVTANATPYEAAFGCLSESALRTAAARPPVRIGVGQVRDFSGKFSDDDGGFKITQGGSQMVISALGKVDARLVRLAERFDTQIADAELAWLDRRVLGDGQTRQIQTPQGPSNVPWLPYYGGTVRPTDYYIVGGITEVNYTVSSGGAEVRVAGIGGGLRQFVMSIGADLRLVDTRTLEVVRTVSSQKQIVGWEVNADVFRFFGDKLVDVNAGRKSQEPLHLGVRTVLERQVLELVGAALGYDTTPCTDAIEARWFEPVPAPALPAGAST